MKKILFLLLLFAGSSVFPATTGYYSVLDFGAVPDGQTLCTEAIQKAIDNCANSGGGKVFIPAGKYLTRPIFLKSNINIEILAGAVLLADTVISEYPAIQGRYGGIESTVYASLFTGFKLENISITGRGILDGQGKVWWQAHEINKEMRKTRR